MARNLPAQQVDGCDGPMLTKDANDVLGSEVEGEVANVQVC